ncbi:hypothetical protein LVJ94_35350 [Pendulispora rubella]|uniref:Uncharacterized protein n=1 Tax=Pendulispora rubella TaxID=2741070 RepID=A0ABZ2KUD5_9BACT
MFVELVTDTFEEIMARSIADAGRRRRAGTTRARRPMRGLELKDDTYAILKVIAADGSEIPLVDSSSETGQSTEYSNFILQSVTESRMEKSQIVDTFGEAYVFFFGEHPRFLDCQAIVLNSADFGWEAEFWTNYDRYFRGTRLVEMGARTYLFFDDTIVEGYMLGAQARKVSDAPLSVELSFRLFITNYSNVTFVGDPNFPVRASVNLPPDVSLSSADAFDVGRAALRAATDAALEEAAAGRAALGQAQQARGFGGADLLSDALRSGLVPGSDLSGIASNALESLFGGATSSDLARHLPVRGKISDNLDEYTALPPRPKDDAETEEAKQGQAEARGDLPTTLTELAAPYGADLNSPGAYDQLGLAPIFAPGAGFAGATFGASIFAGIDVFANVGAAVAGAARGLLGAQEVPSGVGVPAGFIAGFGAGAGYAGAVGEAGIGGAAGLRAGAPNFLGTPASFGAGAPSSPFAPPLGSPGYGAPGYAPPLYAASAFPTGPLASPRGPVYVNGVQVGGGLAGGVGIGGGVAGGIASSRFGVLTGGTSFDGHLGGGAGAGYGASIAVSGTPTCFAMASVPGSLTPAPLTGNL